LNADGVEVAEDVEEDVVAAEMFGEGCATEAPLEASELAEQPPTASVEASTQTEADRTARWSAGECVFIVPSPRTRHR
jgi:hypothetical protein